MTDLDEALFAPCQPSALPRRDESLARDGVAPRDLARVKELVAAVGLGVVSTEPPPSLRSRLLLSLARPGRFGRYVDRLARMFDLSAADAEDLVRRIDDEGAWSPFLIPGLELLQVPAGPRFAGAIATIAKLQPGTSFPHHTHRGSETMFVLAGGFREDSGREVWRGDEITSGDGSHHEFVALDGEPCITASLVEGVIEL